MWNSVLTGVKVQSESSDSTTIYQLQDQWRKNYTSLILKYYFERWKNLAKDKATTEKKKETAYTKLDRGKKKCYSSWNCIDLNKILFQNEVELMSKFWSMWKEAVKNNKKLPKADIKAKSKCLHKPNQAVNQSLSGVHCTVMHESYGYKTYDATRKYFNLWKGNIMRHSVSETSAQLEKNKNHMVYSERMKSTSDTMCVLGSNYTYGDNTDIGILRYYLNIWRAAKSNSPTVINQDVPTSKIEIFLTAIKAKAAEMKTAKKVKSNHFSQHSLHPKRRKSCDNNSLRRNHLSDRVQAWNSVSFTGTQAPLKENVEAGQLDPRGNVKSENISSIKKEVNVSLEEARSLLESTIAASYRGNCARRKAFKRCTRKGSPLPLEMPAGDILERMKARELERAARWQHSRERKERREKERMVRLFKEEREKLTQQEQSRTLKLQEEKQEKMRKMLEEKNLEEIRKKYHQLNSKALKHYSEKLLGKGLQSFVNEAKTAAAHELQASKYHEKMLIQRKFNDWKNATHHNCEMRISSAVDFHKQILLRSCIKHLHKLQREYTSNKQAATDFCEMRTQEKAFIFWNQYTCDIMIEINLKAEIADMFYKRCLLRKSLCCWKRLPSVMECERARERIKNSFRMKVLEIFPDFCPQIEDDREQF